MLVDEEYEKVKMMIRTLSQVVLYNANLTNLNNVTGDQVIIAAVIYNFKISDAHYFFLTKTKFLDWGLLWLLPRQLRC